MIPLIDTHQHLMYKDRFTYEWAGGVPQLAEADFPLTAYQSVIDKGQIAGSIFMETAVDKPHYQDETRFVSSLCEDPDNNILGLIAAAFPEDEDTFDDWLEESAENPHLVGYRRVLHVVDNAVSQGEVFRQNVRKIGDRGKTFDLCFLESQLDVAFDLAKACDNTQLILNHCGVPDVASGDRKNWYEKMARLAQLEHVAVKISGVTAYCGPGQDVKSAVLPYIEESISLFGWDRCVWGSDWPVVNMGDGLPSWLKITKEIFDSEDAANQQKLFQDNAKRIYRL
ncbi:uncharacterized protein MXMO3_02373 [Maritalea myrionectae]|uniref:Amidohydrolase-related domain-containing protein n=1 Tax=Maritalea myrionectae TaxID=454601 RepID=A0A2R4MG73_9HYPH|nr:amidohydrolase family protein [Maritalea myrionectae]AVX04886.1 uncharacterized protein MXMO3_02373 [Maritalea myrionectae]